ncbi:uncharacterized protein [Zea mays]|jgi:hypothetical protein|uniref:C2 domain-containing protein n=1 Tax=Zea mays TaxID=4577 RepID=A0A1D6LKB7_MAIZE|nr:uncharacterized protein LOC103629419 [Zea mays]AQK80153.1 hypothetical protein ZEAMMB73_Zm00001d036016 [Zea mays]|eukprot:XP_008648770.1 uncharacterized protein LOC103629419 [Zea mays]
MSSSLRFLRPKNDGGGGDDGCFDGVELEVTVLSADSLRLPPSYSPLPRRLRPYVTVASSDAPAGSACSTAVAVGSGGGGGEHAWGDTLVVPVGAGFLEGRAHVHVSVLSEPACRLVGATPLGWCRIPVADVLDGLRPPRALRRLSYSLRCPRRGGGGGAWGHGVVHLSVRLLGLRDDAPAATATATDATPPVQQGWCRVAMGIPVSGPSSAAASAVVGMPLSWGATTSR